MLSDIIGASSRPSTVNAFIDNNEFNAYNAGMLSHESPMATLTIRNVDPTIKERLRVRAAQNGRSMEAELRAIVTDAIEAPPPPPELNLYDRIRARFELRAPSTRRHNRDAGKDFGLAYGGGVQ